MFGQVTEGMDVINQMAKVPTDQNDRPRIPIKIFDCGELDLGSGLVKRGPTASIFNQEREQESLVPKDEVDEVET